MSGDFIHAVGELLAVAAIVALLICGALGAVVAFAGRWLFRLLVA